MSEMNESELSENISNITELPWPTYNKYFKVTSKDSKNFFVKCKLCVNSKTYFTVIKSSSNLKKNT